MPFEKPIRKLLAVVEHAQVGVRLRMRVWESPADVRISHREDDV